MSPSSARRRDDGVRVKCVVVSWSDHAASLVMQIRNPKGGNPIVRPVAYYPKPDGKSFKVGAIVRVNIAMEFNRRTRKVELKGFSLGCVPKDEIEPIPYEVAIRMGIVGQDEKAAASAQPRRQQMGPPATTDGKKRDHGFRKRSEESPASGDATSSSTLSPTCDLPVRSVCSDSQEILPKQIKYSTEEEASSSGCSQQEIQESQLFGVDAEVIKPNRIEFVKDGCTYYGDLEEDVVLTDLDGVSTNLGREDVQGRVQAGQPLLVDVKVGPDYARIFAVKITDQPGDRLVGLNLQEAEQGQDGVPDADQTQNGQFQDAEDQDAQVDPATGDLCYVSQHLNDEVASATEEHPDAQEKSQDESLTEVLVSGSGEIPVPVQSVEGAFEPVATDEELMEVDKMEERLASIYSCNAYVATEDAAVSSRVEDPDDVETDVETLPDNNLAKGLSFQVEGQKMTAKQIAESAALDAVGAFMRKFLRYDEMAVEVMVEGFQRKLLGSITEKYNVQDAD